MTPRPPPATLFTRPATSSADTGSASSAIVGSVRPHPDRRTERVTVDISHSLLDSSGRTSLGTWCSPDQDPVLGSEVSGSDRLGRPRTEAQTPSEALAAASLSSEGSPYVVV